MDEGVDAAGGGHGAGDGGHHLGVQDRHDRHIVGALVSDFLHVVGVVNGDVPAGLAAGAGSGGDGEAGHGHILKAVHTSVVALVVQNLGAGVSDQDSSTLGRVHGAAAAHAQDTVHAILEAGVADAVHQVSGGVGLDLVEHHVLHLSILQGLEHHVQHTQLHQKLLGDHQHLVQAALLDLAADGGSQTDAAV